MGVGKELRHTILEFYPVETVKKITEDILHNKNTDGDGAIGCIIRLFSCKDFTAKWYLKRREQNQVE